MNLQEAESIVNNAFILSKYASDAVRHIEEATKTQFSQETREFLKEKFSEGTSFAQAAATIRVNVWFNGLKGLAG